MYIPICKPSISTLEAEAVRKVVLSTRLTEGREVRKFEEQFADYIGTKFAVGFFNGTVALHSILLALGIGKSDEVIVPSFTFISTVTSVIHAGARPVFADIEPETMTLNPQDVMTRITKKTKAVIVVHYAGQAADMESFMKIAEKKKVFIIEDAAESIGATYKGRKVGNFGIAGMFSATPTKVITTGEGGMVTTNNKALVKKMRLLKNHGQDRPYHHILIGYNYRMTEIQAAIGICQLAKLESLIAQRRQKARYLNEKLKDIEGITVPREAEGSRHIYMMYTLRIDKKKLGVSRDELMAGLRKKGIETKLYFPPVHQQPVFKKSSFIRGKLSITDNISKEVLSLPIYPLLKQEELDYILNAINKIIRNKRKNYA